MQLQIFLKQYQKVPKSVVVQQGAGKFLGMRRIFARILANLPEKKLRPPKQKVFMFFWAPLGDIFAHIFKGLLRFSGSLWRFSEILPWFPRIFLGFSTNQNFWWCAFTPTSYISGAA